MPVNLSVKNVPEDLAEKLRQRAKRHHRSLQGELLAILEEATGGAKLPLREAEDTLKGLGLATAEESTAWVREMRDAR